MSPGRRLTPSQERFERHFLLRVQNQPFGGRFSATKFHDLANIGFAAGFSLRSMSN